MGFEVAASKCDVRVRSDVDAAVDTAVQHFGGLDIAVANAGQAEAEILWEYAFSEDSWGQMMAYNGPCPFPVSTGIVKAVPFLDMLESDFDDVIAVNLK